MIAAEATGDNEGQLFLYFQSFKLLFKIRIGIGFRVVDKKKSIRTPIPVLLDILVYEILS